ncbi:hypothetical protein [Mycobacterium sp.]|uniref:hypothetical protein n=1 Tax=Mycobacterium sp. TaxID=1785 RepID=UPI003D0EF83B
MADGGIFQIIWPGVSTLLGAIVGGGVTFLANIQKNSQETRASKDARKRAIEDRSFAATVDYLKAARLLTTAMGVLCYDVYIKEPRENVLKDNAEADQAAWTIRQPPK